MKKKAKKHTPKTSSSRSKVTFVPQIRIMVIGSSLVVALVAFVLLNKSTVRQSVQGVSIMKGLFAEATVQLPQIPGATSYNIYYDVESATGFSQSVPTININNTSYTVQYLKKGETYKYKITAVDSHGEEFWFSPVYTMTNLVQM